MAHTTTVPVFSVEVCWMDGRVTTYRPCAYPETSDGILTVVEGYRADHVTYRFPVCNLRAWSVSRFEDEGP